jgi:hypothetical protein
MDLTRLVTDKLLSQCVNLVGSEDNQRIVRKRLIDPLVAYFKQKMRIFFVIIIILLCCILIANLVIIGYFVNLRSILGGIMNQNLLDAT